MSENNINNTNDTGQEAVKKESNGTITFASEVISTIAGLAAMDIKGVAGMSGGFADGFVELLGKKNVTKGIKVEVGTEEVAVDIAVVVEYGSPIQEVAENIQQSVIKAIETMTGLKVVEVNVKIEGVKLNEPPKEVPAKKSSKQIEGEDTVAEEPEQPPRVK